MTLCYILDGNIVLFTDYIDLITLLTSDFTGGNFPLTLGKKIINTHVYQNVNELLPKEDRRNSIVFYIERQVVPAVLNPSTSILCFSLELIGGQLLREQ